MWLHSTGYSFGTPHADQYASQVPPPPTTPGTAPLGFAPATTPTQDLSKAPTGQPDFPYSQYGKKNVHKEVCRPFSVPSVFKSSPDPVSSYTPFDVMTTAPQTGGRTRYLLS